MYESRCTAKNSWWWAERLPETCGVVIPIKLEFSASAGLIYKESITMHGHTILKYSSTACIYFCALSADWPQSFHSHSAIVDVWLSQFLHGCIYFSCARVIYNLVDIKYYECGQKWEIHFSDHCLKNLLLFWAECYRDRLHPMTRIVVIFVLLFTTALAWISYDQQFWTYLF